MNLLGDGLDGEDEDVIGVSVAAPAVDSTAPTLVSAQAVLTVLNLGNPYGKLIAPIQVGSDWFYYWDRDGDSTPSENDYVPGHNFLDALFTYASDLTTVNPSSDTTDVYRFGSLGGLTLALPSLQEYQAIRTSANGLPSGWLQDQWGSYYWTATPDSSADVHASYSPLLNVIHADDPDSYSMGVALQVIGTARPRDSTGETIALTLNFDGAVSGLSSGTNSTIFTVGGSGVSATWSGTGDTRTLTYTIAAGQNGQAAIDETALKTALVAGITDAAGNAFAYSGNIPDIDASALPVVDTRFDAAKDFIAGPTAQSTDNIWQYFSANYSGSNISDLQLLSDWDLNGNGLIALNQWDGNWTDANYPFVQKQTNGTLIIHPDRADDGSSGRAVVVAWKNTTASNATIDLAGSLNLVGDALSSFGGTAQNPSADGITYLVTTSASVSSEPSVLLQGSLDEDPSTEAPSSTALSLGGQVLAPGAMIAVAVHAGSNYFWDHTQLDLQVTPRPATIDLGSYGQLIAPVQVEGKWYYHWDRNGDGTSAGDGYNKNPVSSYPLSEVYDLFKQDINGVAGAATNNTYRYAVINGVKLALPELGADLSGVNGGGYRAPGTSISGPQDTNNTYDGLFAIWDAHNGGQVGTGMSGMPPGWLTESYVSATPFIKDWYAPENEYAFIRTYDGLIEPHANWEMNVALQVL